MGCLALYRWGVCCVERCRRRLLCEAVRIFVFGVIGFVAWALMLNSDMMGGAPGAWRVL